MELVEAFDSGALRKSVFALAPVANAAGTRMGVAIDRLGYKSITILGITGATTGTPTSFTYDVKITHSDTSGGTYTDYKYDRTNVAQIAAATASGVLKEFDCSLAGAKRYLKLVEVTAFVGGSSPTLLGTCHVILGGADVVPAV